LTGTGKLLMAAGAILLAAGALLYILGTFFPMLGKLPGDIAVTKKNVTIYFPLTTMIIVSVVLTLILNLISRWIK
jgi:surface polysaccharide O-acyltransferase-like enzyme